LGNKRRKSYCHLTVKQKKIVYEEYLKEEKNGRKINPEKMVLLMKNPVDSNGNKMFSYQENLTKQQISSQLSEITKSKFGYHLFHLLSKHLK
jgi:hypothetical protein